MTFIRYYLLIYHMPFCLCEWMAIGLSRLLNTVVMRDRRIPLMLMLNAQYRFVKADRSLTHVITFPIPLLKYLHARKNYPYL